MYERRQSFCEFGAERRRSMLVPVVIATIRRATSAEWAWSQGLQSTPMMPANYPPHLSTLLARGQPQDQSTCRAEAGCERRSCL